MEIKSAYLSSLGLVGLLVAGCGSGETADTAPLPNQSAQTRVDDATEKVEASTMTPEQKAAAENYLKQGAANAQQIHQSAQEAGQGAPK